MCGGALSDATEHRMPNIGDRSTHGCPNCGQPMYWTEAAVRNPDLLARSARGVESTIAYVDAYRCANGHTSKECPSAEATTRRRGSTARARRTITSFAAPVAMMALSSCRPTAPRPVPRQPCVQREGVPALWRFGLSKNRVPLRERRRVARPWAASTPSRRTRCGED